jgi:hypothetical protein
MVEGIVPLLAGLVLLKAFLTRLIVEQKRGNGDREICSVKGTQYRIENSNIEIRNSKQILNQKFKCSKSFEFWSF